MATGVGLYVGASDAVAAVRNEHDTEPVLVTCESILHMSPGGESMLGGPAPEGYASIGDYVSFVGSPAGIAVDENEPYRAEDLVATAVFNLINLVAGHLDGPAEFYATYPAEWPAGNVRLLREALDYLGLRSVALTASTEHGVSAATAAAQMAHSAVLATPAGTTPPDPTGLAETANVSTTVLPAINKEISAAQAYSATMADLGDANSTLSAEGASRHTAVGIAPAVIPPAGVDHRVAIGAMIVAVAALAAAGVFGGMALHGATDKSGTRPQAAPRPATTVIIAPPAPTPTAAPMPVHRAAPPPAPAPTITKPHVSRAAPVSAPQSAPHPTPAHRTPPPASVPVSPPPASEPVTPPAYQQPYANPYSPYWRDPYGSSPFDEGFPFDGGVSQMAPSQGAGMPSQPSPGGVLAPFAP